ncbi:MAG TPA: radical SAM protein [Syntrophomonadaceae bacterium]|nr:radical SAM protein [Syntrophomonadaceae bacterium]
MRYEGNIYRPPSEARSYLLQCTVGCTHNQCTFCGMYKDKKYRVRSMEEIMADIRMARMYYGDLEKVFLCDGDALAMETVDLLAILAELYRSFPHLHHVGIYASPSSILDKALQDLQALREAGLTIAYLGVETGDRELLVAIRKGVTYEEMVEAGRKVREAGILLSVTVLLGLAGRTPKALDHARNTARILNEINPDYIGALTLMVVPKTEIDKKIKKGEFEVPAPFEILDEMRIIIQNLDVQGTEIRSNHASNYLPIKGRLPQDKEKILKLINDIINKNDTKYLRPDYLRAL